MTAGALRFFFVTVLGSAVLLQSGYIKICPVAGAEPLLCDAFYQDCEPVPDVMREELEPLCDLLLQELGGELSKIAEERTGRFEEYGDATGAAMKLVSD